MKTNMRIALIITLGLGGLTYLVGQERAPLSEVKDEMDRTQSSSSEVPATAPRVSDIDRLFDNPAEDAARAAKEQEENGLTSLAGSVESPLDQDMSLDVSDLISVDYPNEEIRTVLRNVADLYSLNIVVPDSLTGTTSIKLRDVTWRQIYSVVLDPAGYSFVEDGSIIKIISKDALAVEPPVTEIFIINYAEAAVIAGTLRNLVNADAGGQVQVDKRSNAIIVTERASRMEALRAVVGRLDKPTQQVHIETRFIEVNNSDIKNIGVNWSTLREFNVGAGPFETAYTRDSTGTRSKEFGDQTNLGDVSFDSGDSSISGNGVSRGTLVDNITGTTLIDATSTGSSNVFTSAFDNLRSIANGKASTAVFSADQIGLVLSALKEQGGSRLVSNPTVVTLNNQEATIAVGRQEPLPNYQFNEETGQFIVSGVEFLDVGIILKVTPSVNSQGLITLKVAPEVSSVIGERSFDTASYPIISTRRTDTQIALQDGYTMGIGGLMETENKDNKNHVPVLGKVPGLGKLFRHQNKEETKTSLLIFITARILASEESNFEDVFSKEMLDAAGVDAISLKNR